MHLKVVDLGLVDFKDAWRKQKELFSEVKNGLLNAAVITCCHYPVITLGRSADRKNILVTQEELQRKGIGLYEIERGGDVTYHGPGQLTVYPIFNLNYFKKDIHWFLRYLENLIILCLDDFGIKSEQVKGLTGVWIGERKIASIGIAVKNWISFHGLSINIKKDDLTNFYLIKPCGMDIMVTSVESEVKSAVSIEKLKENFIHLLEAKENNSHG